MTVEGYVLESSDGDEYLLVIRSKDTNALFGLVKRMTRMRDDRLKRLGRALEKDLNGKCR